MREKVDVTAKVLWRVTSSPALSRPPLTVFSFPRGASPRTSKRQTRLAILTRDELTLVRRCFTPPNERTHATDNATPRRALTPTTLPFDPVALPGGGWDKSFVNDASNGTPASSRRILDYANQGRQLWKIHF